MMSKQEREAEERAEELLRHVQKHGEELIGLVAEERHIARIGTLIGDRLVLSPKQLIAARTSFSDLLGKRLTVERLRRSCRRISLALELIREGTPVQPARFLRGRVKCRVRHVAICADPTFSLEPIEGVLATKLILRPYTQKIVQAVGHRAGLMGRNWRVLCPRELYGIELTAGFYRKDGTLKPEGYYQADDAQRRRNASLRLRRQKREKKDCRMRWDGEDTPCYLCLFGTEDCELATHLRKWDIRQCGNRHKSYHGQDGCLLCRQGEYKREHGVSEFGSEPI